MAIIPPSARGHRVRLAYRAAAIAAAIALVAAVPTIAAEPEPAGGPHCAVELTQPAGGGPAMIKSEQCFATFAEALVLATAGRAKVAPDVVPADLTADIVGVPQAVTGDAVLLSRWTLGYDFKAPNYGPESRTYFVDGANPPCSNGVRWEIDNLDLGWSNSISSAQGWSGCNHFMHYDLPNQQGAVWPCVPNCPTMGAMDNRTTSLLWFQ